MMSKTELPKGNNSYTLLMLLIIDNVIQDKLKAPLLFFLQQQGQLLDKFTNIWTVQITAYCQKQGLELRCCSAPVSTCIQADPITSEQCVKALKMHSALVNQTPV